MGLSDKRAALLTQPRHTNVGRLVATRRAIPFGVQMALSNDDTYAVRTIVPHRWRILATAAELRVLGKNEMLSLRRDCGNEIDGE